MPGCFWGAQWTKTKERQHVVGVATSTDQLLKKQAAPVEHFGGWRITAWLRVGF